MQTTKCNYITLYFLVLLPLLLGLSACKKYLEAPSDKSLVVPTTLDDMQAMLDYNSILNTIEPVMSEVASDNYYLKAANYSNLNINVRNNYAWAPKAEYLYDWTGAYTVVLYGNVILDNIDRIQKDAANTTRWNTIKGSALFFRAHAFYNVAGQFCKAYTPTTAAEDLGIVLRLSSDVNAPSVRSSMAESYARIIEDLKQAASLLPLTTAYLTRPDKAAAYGDLARTYLVMGDYQSALLYADSCLMLHPAVLDFNDLNPALAGPVPSFNAEVIFHTTTGGVTALAQNAARVDSVLYDSYEENDLRKSIFFKTNSDGTHAFKGTFDGTFTPGKSACFTGLTSGEMLLVKSECLARLGQGDQALSTLKTLMDLRFKRGTYTTPVVSSADDALLLILNERRKELIFRSRRWQDLKRLNKEARFATTLTRVIGDQVYTLAPNDSRYAMLIPSSVIGLSQIPQNSRP
ncbi:RagB/SusD family nutrient uptake outer membrane protein [Chitinophaga defluvii]|uniref:RagB/SusD family nutrient uptake outer membrane protein n=1 Tax=Chitinophaga defluvii TaxID=3163343 RepID=A0ABV2TCC1_9BACT